MGNRGILHDSERHSVRRGRTQRRIAFRTAFRERRREPMRPHSSTELFVLTQATACAAGHRPCAERPPRQPSALQSGMGEVVWRDRANHEAMADWMEGEVPCGADV
jgi:hypothetical protein